MITMKMQLFETPNKYFRLIYNLQKIAQRYNKHNTLKSLNYTTSVDSVDVFTMELLQRHRSKRTNSIDAFTIRNFMDIETNSRDVSKMTTEELDNETQRLISENKDKELTDFIMECYRANIILNDYILKKLFRHYSVAGKPDVVKILQKYSLKIDVNLYNRNGQFTHYMAKAQCMRGNSEKGLSILTECYEKNESLRSFYRTMLRELIQDSVLNRSEASLVIFKKYVLSFSEKWGDHYPLVCFWHICWSSSWFSDQMLSNELLEASPALRNIIQDRATAFSLNILKQEYNEDAVMRLLQVLLKYELMVEYVKVLQILFAYKLRNRDMRGCSEIIRNCEALGITLPSSQQGRYIKMLISGTTAEAVKPSVPKPSTPKPSLHNFKFKF